MAAAELELRVASLEAEMARVKEQLGKSAGSQGDWLDEIFGVFDHDPIYEKRCGWDGNIENRSQL